MSSYLWCELTLRLRNKKTVLIWSTCWRWLKVPYKGKSNEDALSNYDVMSDNYRI